MLDLGHWPRRDFLSVGAGAAAGLLLPGASAQAQRRAAAPDLWLELTAAARAVALRDGAQTPVWSYRARVLAGDPASVQSMPGAATYLGPVLHLRRGQRVRIDFVNQLDRPSIVNWHGLHVPALMMGLPRYQVRPGQRYRYEFTVLDRAGTYWYHAMSAGDTPEQVYFGLAGVLVVSDDEDSALALPRGASDLPLVIQDRDWGADNRFAYPGAGGPGTTAGEADGGGMGGGMMPRGGMMGRMMGGGGMMSGGMGAMMTRMMGFFGRSILVNGRPDAAFEVAAHAYRLRLLNASNARTYKLAWSDGRPMTVIATGGGLLAQPVAKDFVMLTAGQRVELWADFSGDAAGTRLTLKSLAFSGSMRMQNMMDQIPGGDRVSPGMMGRWSSLPDGAEFAVAQVRVARPAGGAPAAALPRRFPPMPRLRAEDAANCDRPRVFRVTMGGMRWGFNGRSFDMGQVAANEVVKLGSTEIWEFRNNMMMAHAIHLHGLQFLVLERENSPGPDVRAGCVDQGWMDTVLLMPNERVRLLMRFQDFTGLYAYQCHMLEHAAAGLMRNYAVR